MLADAMTGQDITYQDLWDYLEGAVTAPEKRRAVERALECDAALADEFTLMRAQHRVLSQADAGVLEEKVPQRLLDVVRRARLRAI